MSIIIKIKNIKNTLINNKSYLLKEDKDSFYLLKSNEEYYVKFDINKYILKRVSDDAIFTGNFLYDPEKSGGISQIETHIQTFDIEIIEVIKDVKKIEEV